MDGIQRLINKRYRRPIHLYRICTQQMMEISRYSILKIRQLHFHHLHISRRRDLDTIRQHAKDLIVKREVPAYIANDGKVKRRCSEWDYLRKRQLQRHMIKKIRNQLSRRAYVMASRLQALRTLYR